MKQDCISICELRNDIDYPNYEIIAVDNGSTDSSCDFLKVNFPNVGLIENSINLLRSWGLVTGYRKARECLLGSR